MFLSGSRHSFTVYSALVGEQQSALPSQQAQSHDAKLACLGTCMSNDHDLVFAFVCGYVCVPVCVVFMCARVLMCLCATWQGTGSPSRSTWWTCTCSINGGLIRKSMGGLQKRTRLQCWGAAPQPSLGHGDGCPWGLGGWCVSEVEADACCGKANLNVCR
jgi:hypothetical protein